MTQAESLIRCGPYYVGGGYPVALSPSAGFSVAMEASPASAEKIFSFIFEKTTLTSTDDITGNTSPIFQSAKAAEIVRADFWR